MADEKIIRVVVQTGGTSGTGKAGGSDGGMTDAQKARVQTQKLLEEEKRRTASHKEE